MGKLADALAERASTGKLAAALKSREDQEKLKLENVKARQRQLLSMMPPTHREEDAKKELAKSQAESWAQWRQRMVSEAHFDVDNPQSRQWVMDKLGVGEGVAASLLKPAEWGMTALGAIDAPRRALVDLTDDALASMGVPAQAAVQMRRFAEGATIAAEVALGFAGAPGAIAGVPGAAVAKMVPRSAATAMKAAKGKLITQWLDALHPVKQAAPKAYDELRLLNGVMGQVEAAFEKGMLQWDEVAGAFHPKGTALREVFQGIDDITQLDMYFIARRAKELTRRGIKVPMTDDAIEAGLELGRLDPKLVQAFDKWHKFNGEMLEFSRQMGLVDDTTYTRLMEAGHDYVPFVRKMVDEKVQTAARGAKTTPLRAIKGSEAGEILSPSESIPQATSAWIEAAIRNRANLHMVDAVNEALPGTFERVGSMQFGRNPALVERMKRAGVMRETSEDLVAIFGKPRGEDIIQVFREGKKEFYRIKDPEILTAVQSMQPFHLGALLKGGKVMADVLRGGVTMNPAFMARNLIRDTMTASVQTNSHMRPIYDTVKGMASRVVRDDDYWEFMANGGGFASRMVSEFRNPDKAAMAAKWLKQRTGIRGTLDIVTDPKMAADALKRGLARFSEYAEIANRMAEFKRAQQAGMSARAAALAAREVSTDFALRGAHPFMREYSAVLPFFNAAAQGVYKAGRTVAEHPRRTLLRTMAYAVLPSMAVDAMNRDDPNYALLPEYVKEMYLAVPSGDEGFILIPRGFEYGAVGAAVSKLLEDKEVGGAARVMLNAISPLTIADPHGEIRVPLPQALRPLMDVEANKRWTGSPIIPYGQENIRKPYQGYPWTSSALKASAQALYEATGVEFSPPQMEHLINGYLGWFGATALDIADFAYEHDLTREDRTTPVKKKPGQAAGIGGLVRSFYRTPIEDSSSQAIADAYEMLDEMRIIAATQKHIAIRSAELGDDPGDLTESMRELRLATQQVTGANSDLSGVDRLVRATKHLSPEEKRNTIDYILRTKNALFETYMREPDAYVLQLRDRARSATGRGLPNAIQVVLMQGYRLEDPKQRAAVAQMRQKLGITAPPERTGGFGLATKPEQLRKILGIAPGSPEKERLVSRITHTLLGWDDYSAGDLIK